VPDSSLARGIDGSEANTGPDQGVEALERLLAASTDGYERPAIAGRLGLAWLDTYEKTGDPGALAAGLSRLHATVDAVPEHPDRVWWRLWLGLGYAETARRSQSTMDYRGSIDWISSLYAEAAPDCPARSKAARVLVDVCWEQLWLLRVQGPDDPVAALAGVDGLVARLTALLSTAADPADLPWSRMAAGLALLFRHELTEVRADLDRGLDLLAAAPVWDATTDPELLARVGSELANAWRRRGLLSADEACLDRAIEVGRRILDNGDIAAGLAMQLLYLNLAYSYEARWNISQRPEDLDGAVSSWRTLMDSDAATPVEILAARPARPLT
jgi:hypothetical protein